MQWCHPILVAVSFVCFPLIEDYNTREVDNIREYKGVVIERTGVVATMKGKVHVG